MIERLLLLSSVIIGAGTVLFSMSPGPTLKPLVMGKRGAVAAGHPLVAEAGLRMLEKGGNAVDAGVASVFAAAVVEQASVGMGGEAPILIKLKGKPVVAINGAGIAPELATADFYRQLAPGDPRRVNVSVHGGGAGAIPSYGPLSAIVPGLVDALLVAEQEFGRLTLRDVLQPAIELAQGFPADAKLCAAIEQNRATIEKWPEAKRVYLPAGRPPRAGEIWAQPDLARTLQTLADIERKNQSRGRAAAIEAVREYFYRGPLARRIAEFCKSAGCLLREADFAVFRAGVEAPLTTNYRGVDVYKAGFWTQGPVFLENLNLLEGFDLKSMGWGSPEYVHTVVEAMKLGYADRDAYYGDPAHSRIPEQLLSKQYAKLRRGLIDSKRASAEHIPGDPTLLKPRASEEFIRARYADRNPEHRDTTCVNVIDQDGNMFSATPSGAWIPAVIAGDTGLPLSERAQQFVMTPGHPNQIVPHKRPRLTLTPTIATRNGQPWLAFSTPGGDSQDQTLLQVFLNVVEFGMNPQEAVEAPRFNSRGMYDSFDTHADRPLVLEIERRFPEKTLDGLRARGHQLLVQGDWDNSTAPTMVEFDGANGVIRAGADVRGHRYAAGW